MKNKITLLLSASVLALMACSSLEVSNPESENFPEGWSVAEYMAANPDLRALQFMDQVAIMNTQSGLSADENDAAQNENAEFLASVAVNYAGFTTWTEDDAADRNKLRYVQSFNINGVTNELEVFATLVLDSSAIAKQYVAYGKREGRPYRMCDGLSVSVEKGDCQQDESGYFEQHLYCSQNGVTYCVDCDANDVCPVAPVTDPVVSDDESDTAPVDETVTDPTEESGDEPATEPTAEETTPTVDESAEA